MFPILTWKITEMIDSVSFNKPMLVPALHTRPSQLKKRHCFMHAHSVFITTNAISWELLICTCSPTVPLQSSVARRHIYRFRTTVWKKTHYGKGFPSLTPPDLKWANTMKGKVLDCSTSSHLQHNNPRHRYSTGSNSWLPAVAFTAHAWRQRSLKQIRRWQGERQQCFSASCCLGIPLDKKWNATVRCCVCLCMSSVSFLSKCCVFFFFLVSTPTNGSRHPASLFFSSSAEYLPCLWNTVVKTQPCDLKSLHREKHMASHVIFLEKRLGRAVHFNNFP